MSLKIVIAKCKAVTAVFSCQMKYVQQTSGWSQALF